MDGSTRTTFTPGETITRKHPFRGLLWGLMLGLGLAVVAVVTTLIPLSLVNVIGLLVFGMVVGVLWGSLGPARAPNGPAPAPRTAGPIPEPTRFDDFDLPAGDGTGDEPTTEPTDDVDGGSTDTGTGAEAD